MVDQRLIQILKSGNTEQRKKAVLAIAKTADRDALPYLAQVYKSDSDAEVRELAKKAGAYINKNAVAAPAPAVEETYDTGYYDTGYEDDGYEDDAYDDSYEDDEPYTGGDFYEDPFEVDDEEEKVAPLPPEFNVSSVDKQRAQGYVDQAMEFNLRGDNQKAQQQLQRALSFNPGLVHDDYTRSLSATVMGMSAEDAMAALQEGASKRRKSSSKSRIKSSPLQTFLAFLVMIGGIVGLMGFAVLPWFDMSDAPAVSPISGEPSTLQGVLNELDAQFAVLGGAGPQAEQFRDALNAIKTQISGYDISLFIVGAQNELELFGFDKFFELLLGELGGDLGDLEAESSESPAPLDYTIPLTGIMAGVAILLSLFMLSSQSIGSWITMIVVGILGFAPLMYFYLDAVNTVFVSDSGDSVIADGANFDPVDFLGQGFWVSVVGMLAVVILPFIALLFAPSAE